MEKRMKISTFFTSSFIFALHFMCITHSKENLVTFLNAFKFCSLTFHVLLNENDTGISTMVATQRIFSMPFQDATLFFKIYLIEQANISLSLKDNRKFAECTVFLFPETFLKNVAQFDVSPNFIWFMKLTKAQRRAQFLKLVNLSSPVKFLEMRLQSFQVSFICIPCLTFGKKKDALSTIHFSEPEFFSIKYLHQKWTHLHRNMYGAYVEQYESLEKRGNLARFFSKDGQPCVHYPVRTSIDSKHCAGLVLSVKLNFSLTWQPGSKPKPEKGPHSTFRAYGLVSQDVIGKWKERHWQVVSYSIVDKMYAFILVDDGDDIISQNQLDGILKPFGWQIWVTLIVAAISFAFILSFSSHSSKRKKGRVLDIAVNLITLVLDQPASCTIFNRKYLNKIAIMISWMLWSFFCILISQKYKSCLFYYLSEIPRREVPENSDQLVNRGIVTGTMTSHLIATNQLIPTLIMSILPPLIKSEKKRRDRRGYRKLKRNLVWFTDSPVNFSRRQKINSNAVTWSMTDAWRKMVPLPKQFAIIDTMETLEAVKTFLELGGVKWVSREVPIPAFMVKRVWTCYYNYFYPVFVRSFSHLYESGIMERWSKVVARLKKESGIKSILVENMVSKSNKTKLGKKGRAQNNVLAGMNWKRALKEMDEDSEQESTILEKNVFIEILYHFLVCILFAVVAFIGECALFILKWLIKAIRGIFRFGKPVMMNVMILTFVLLS